MKAEKFDYVDEKDAIRIIGMRLKKIGRIVSPEFKNELEYELRDFFKSKNNYRGTVELELRSDSDLIRSEEHTSELQSRGHLVCRLLLEKKNKTNQNS